MQGKRVVSERPERRPGPPDVKSPTDDEEARHAESAAKGRLQSQPAKREPAAVQVCDHKPSIPSLFILSCCTRVFYIDGRHAGSPFPSSDGAQ